MANETTPTLEKLVTVPILSYYDTKLKTWVQTKLDSAIASISKIMTLKGVKATLEEVQALENPAIGDMWRVGPREDGQYAEYYYTEDNKWEFIGVTAAEVSLDGYVDETALFKGEAGTGTIENPAEGTILYPIYVKAKDLADRVAELETAVSNVASEADIDALFEEPVQGA